MFFVILIVILVISKVIVLYHAYVLKENLLYMTIWRSWSTIKVDEITDFQTMQKDDVTNQFNNLMFTRHLASLCLIKSLVHARLTPGIICIVRSIA